MAITNSTTLANVLPEIVAEAVFQANERSLMRALVRNFNIPAGSGNWCCWHRAGSPRRKGACRHCP